MNLTLSDSLKTGFVMARPKFTCDLGITLKHATISVAGMSPNVALLRARPDMFVLKKASGVRMSWVVGPAK